VAVIERACDRTAHDGDATKLLAVSDPDDADAAGHGFVVAVVLRDEGVGDLQRGRDE
jgi:hypothetical protein